MYGDSKIHVWSRVQPNMIGIVYLASEKQTHFTFTLVHTMVSYNRGQTWAEFYFHLSNFSTNNPVVNLRDLFHVFSRASLCDRAGKMAAINTCL